MLARDPRGTICKNTLTRAVATSFPYDIIAPELAPQETVEWSGRPNPTVIFQQEDWFMIPFSLLWGGFTIFWLIGATNIWPIWTNRPDRTFQWFGLIWGTPFVLIGQYMIWGRFFYSRWKKNRTYYALTNRRALLIEAGLGSRKVSSAYFENIAIVDKRVRHDGIGSISFGGPVTGEWRPRNSTVPRFPTFEDIDNADSVYQIATRKQPPDHGMIRPH
jgi:hypothetical protein